mmetsp:Transcript_20879/g.57739  ORF Transcript_20879/g.57739 Transcript_20879/m.57739 type:complete len:272 (-) Transcript_20879:2492-3307(-)
MLHSVSHIRCLDQVLNDNGSLSIHIVPRCCSGRFGRLGLGAGRSKGTIPAYISQILEFLIHHVSCHHRVDNQLAEPLQFHLCATNGSTELGETIFHEQPPGNINRILFSYALLAIQISKCRILLDQLGIWDARMINIMNQSTKAARKLCEGIRRDAVGVTVKSRCESFAFDVVLDVGGCDNATQELYRGHYNVRRMLKVMERVVFVKHGNAVDVVSQLRDNDITQLNGFVVQNRRCNVIVKVRQCDDLFYLIKHSSTTGQFHFGIKVFGRY